MIIQPKTRLTVHYPVQLRIKDIAFVSTDEEILDKVNNIPIVDIESGEGISVIFLIDIARAVRRAVEQADVRFLGTDDIIVEYVQQDKKRNLLQTVKTIVIGMFIVIAAGAALMNYHADVDMISALSRINRIVTNEDVELPLVTAIPYSLGVGLGLYLFFNLSSKKKSKKIQFPSPLKTEIASYTDVAEDLMKEQARNERQEE